MAGYVQASEYPILTGGNRVETWYGAGALNSCPVVFTPATGPAADVETLFVYARGFSNPPTPILPGGFQDPCTIGVITQRLDSFDPDPAAWNLRPSENPVIENGGASPWDNSRFRALNAAVLGGKIVIFASAFDNPDPSSRLFRWESSDGFTFSSPVELTYNGGYFGKPCRGVFEAFGRVWILAGNGSKSRVLFSSPDGVSNWLDHGEAIQIGDEDGAGDDYAMVTGFAKVRGNYVYYWVPAGGVYGDWPEVVTWHRVPLSEMGYRLWDKYPEPVYVRGPNEGAIWSFSPMTINGTRYAFKEHAGKPDWTSTGTTEMNLARDDDYGGYGTDIFSHLSVSVSTDPGSLAEAWDGGVLPVGDVVLRNVENGSYLTAGDTSSGSQVVTTAEITEQAVWTMDVIRGFRRLSVKAAGDIGDQVLDLEGVATANRDIGVVAVINPDNGADDQSWHMPRVGDQLAGRAPVVAIISRESSLALQSTGEGDDAQVKQYPYRGLASQMWEVVEVVPAGDTITVNSPPVTIPLPLGDLVGTTEFQTLSNKTFLLPAVMGTVEDLQTAAAAGEFDHLDDGDTVEISNGLKFTREAARTVAGGAPAEGFKPNGAGSPQHWKTNAIQGITDMGAAANAAWVYNFSLSVIFTDDTPVSGGTLAGPANVIPLDLRNEIIATTVTIGPVGYGGVRVQNGAIIPLVPMTNVLRFVAPSGAWLSTVGAENIIVSCRDIATCGILLRRAEHNPTFNNVRINSLADNGYGMKTEVKATDLVINGLHIGQHEWADADRPDQAKRTATGLHLGTADFQITNVQTYYCAVGIVKAATGPGHFGSIHPYNGAIDTVTDADTIRIIDIQYPSGVYIGAIYAGNGSININCDELNGSTGNKALTIGFVQFFVTGAGDSTHLMRFTTTVANNDMAGLKMAAVTGKDGGINAFRWAPSGAGSFLPLNRLKWTVPTLTDATGEPFQHTDDAGTLLADASPIFAMAGWMNLDQSNTLRFGGSQMLTIEALNGITLQTDANNSGVNGLTVKSDTNTLLVSNETTPLGVNEIYIGLGLASGASHIARIGYSANALVITPTNAAGDAEDSAKQLRFDTTARVWHVEGGFMITGTSAPASASATGTLGEIRMDASYIYICTATDTWKRVAIATW